MLRCSGCQETRGRSRGPDRRFSGPRSHLCDDDLAAPVNGAVIDHADDRDSEVTADPERDAEAEAAHDGDDVAAREPEARAVAQRRFLLLQRRGPPFLRQLDHLTRFLLLLHHPAKIQHCSISETNVSRAAIFFFLSIVCVFLERSGSLKVKQGK